jgi:cobalamin biosynthesis protein CobD/CbiB
MPGIWVVTAAAYYLYPGDGGFNDFLYLTAIGFSVGAALEIVTLFAWQRRPLLRVRRLSSQAAINWDNRPAANWRLPGIVFLVVVYGAMYLVWPPLASFLISLYIGAAFVAVVVVWTLRLRPRPSVLALVKAIHGFSLRPNGPQYAEFRAAIEQRVGRRSSDGDDSA